ncbi:helix-turn-helix domain-containing protein [Clostridium weizhouense]|uniref:Helix-turn-helix domain-containing protein n=1 Tax=Clostridium weizhouense TaxID=2859781 RepID=A0ABS7ARM4_9CLOT|nr:helix-turn-helix transcriptional regulator [Clostridium weizhouense]MBW6411332.1 helix-turn-helix domain-containing protein [Clostridium weizhouense]
MQLGDKLKAIRKAKGISLQKLSDITATIPEERISVSFLSDIENGRSNPSIDSLKIIANALDTPTSYFVEDSQNNTFGEAINDINFLPVIELLKDFNNWNIEDKQELLYYLKAKKVIRNTK